MYERIFFNKWTISGLFVLSTGAVLLHSTLEANTRWPATAPCSAATLNGTYLWSESGYTITGDERVPYVAIGREEFDGRGNVRGAGAENNNGVYGDSAYTGTYTLNRDCSGTIQYVLGTGGQYVNKIYVNSSTGDYQYIYTSPEIVMKGTSQKVTSIFSR